VVTIYSVDDAKDFKKRSRTLSGDEATRTLVYLTSPFSYSDSHPMCTDAGVGLRVAANGKTLDLLIGQTCRHIHLAGTNEEIAFLSETGQEYFVQLFAKSLGAT
jgi:hypothetical protein